MKYFTKAQIEEIRKQLATMGVRDTDLPPVTEMTGEEIIAIVQDGINKQVGILKLFRDYLPEDIAQQLVNGKSAYEIAVENGFVGTEAQWLASLKGDKGDTGETGPQGLQGPAGPQGPQGPAGSGADVTWNQINTTGTKIAEIKIGNSPKIDVKAPSGSSTAIQRATSTELGGIRVGYPSQVGRNFGVQLTSDSAQAFVTVPSDGGGTGGENGGHYEQIFRAVAHGTAVSASYLPAQLAPVAETYGAWKHYVDDSSATSTYGSDYDVWMAIRWVAGDNTPGNWEGPWNISGSDGVAGADGTDIEFIYTRTSDELAPDPDKPDYVNDVQDAASVARQKELNGGTSPTNPTQFADWYPTGWTDNPQGVEPTIRLEWMSFRVKTGGAGGVGGTWQEFSKPVVWSAYGRNGLDGDGVEYIFAVADNAPSGANDPNSWAGRDTSVTPNVWIEPDNYQNREFIPQGSQGVWVDNPINLALSTYAPGSIQWVSMRKKYADAAPGIAPYYTTPYWHEYCTPRMWNYKAKDGVASAAVVSLEPDMFYVPCDADTGMVTAAFSATTKLEVQYAAEVVSPTINQSGITINDTTSSQSVPTGISASVSGSNITVSILSTATVDFRSTQVLVRIPLSITVNSNTMNLEAVLTLVGSSLGENGVSYSIKTSHGILTKHDTNYNTSAIDVSVIVNSGSNSSKEYTVTGSGSTYALSTLGSFSLRYFIGTDTEHMVTMSGDSIPTSGVNGPITIQLVNGLMTIINEYIPFIVEPLVPPTQQILKSIVFKRSADEPAKPGDNVGSFASPVPTGLGWYDGLPPYQEGTRIWMTTRVFTSDRQSPQQSSWTAVQPASDHDDIDIEFAYMQTNDAVPAIPRGTRNGSPSNTNRHLDDYPYGYEGQIWFDPDLDKYDDGPTSTNPSTQYHTRNFEDMYWMAIREKHNSTYSSWTILRIKGEQGDPGIKGEDAIPIRIRNWADLYAATHVENNGTVSIVSLTGTDRIFSGYEEWVDTVGGVSTNMKAPFRDVIVVTPEDYSDRSAFPPSGLPCPSETEEGVLTPALYVVNYKLPATPGTCTAYTSVGYPSVDPNTEPLEDLIIPHDAILNTGAASKNWTVTLYQNAAASADHLSQYGEQWSVFTNLGAIYASILVATQAYIGRLSVDHLSTGDALVGTDIYAGVFEVKKNGVVRARFGVDDAGDIVLQFLDATGTTVLYEFGPTGITSHVSNKAPSYTEIALAGMNTDVSLTPDSSDGSTWAYPASSDFVNYYIFQDGEVTVGGLTTYYVSSQSEQLTTHSQYHGKIFTTGTGSPEGKTTIANGTYLPHPVLYSSALIDGTSNKKIAYDRRTGPVTNPPIGWWFFMVGLRTYTDGQFQNEGTKFLFRRTENGQEISRGTSEPFGMSVLTRVHDIRNIEGEATTYPY